VVGRLVAYGCLLLLLLLLNTHTHTTQTTHNDIIKQLRSGNCYVFITDDDNDDGGGGHKAQTETANKRRRKWARTKKKEPSQGTLQVWSSFPYHVARRLLACRPADQVPAGLDMNT